MDEAREKLGDHGLDRYRSTLDFQFAIPSIIHAYRR